MKVQIYRPSNFGFVVAKRWGLNLEKVQFTTFSWSIMASYKVTVLFSPFSVSSFFCGEKKSQDHQVNVVISVCIFHKNLISCKSHTKFHWQKLISRENPPELEIDQKASFETLGIFFKPEGICVDIHLSKKSLVNCPLLNFTRPFCKFSNLKWLINNFVRLLTLVEENSLIFFINFKLHFTPKKFHFC